MGGSKKISHELLAHLSLGSFMHSINPVLRKFPKEMLEMPFLDMMGVVPKPAHRATMARLLDGLVEEPLGQYTESRFANLVYFVSKAGKDDVDLLNKIADRILRLVESPWDQDSKQIMATKSARFLINYYLAIDQEIRNEIAVSVRGMLFEVSPLTRDKLIELQGNSVCDFSSQELSRMPALDLVQPTKEELLAIFFEGRERVSKTLDNLVKDVLREPLLPRNIREAVSVLGEALKRTKPAESAKIARAYVNIYCAIEDSDLKEEIGQMMSESLTGHGNILKKLLPFLRNNDHFDAMLTFSEMHISPEERTEILKTSIGEHIALFESDPESENAESHLGRVVELVHMGGEELVSHAASRIEPGGRTAMELARILARSGCDETSEDKRDLVIFDMASAENVLQYLVENAESDFVLNIASGKKRKADFQKLIQENAESDEADTAISRLVKETLSREDMRERLEFAISFFIPSFETASPAGKEKIILALAQINRNLPEKTVQDEFAKMIDPMPGKNRKLIKDMIMNAKGEEEKQKSLMIFIGEKLDASDLKEILFSDRKYRIETLLQEFISDPDSQKAEDIMVDIADMACSDNHGNEVLLLTIGMLVNNAAIAEKREHGDLAFERIANCIINISSRIEDEAREDVFSFTTKWLPAISPRLRERMLRILELSICTEKSMYREDLLVFDIVNPYLKELEYLSENARSGYIRDKSKEEKKRKEALGIHKTMITGEIEAQKAEENKLDAFFSSLQEFRALEGEGGHSSTADILYMASAARADLQSYAWPENVPWPTSKPTCKLPDMFIGSIAVDVIRDERPPVTRRALSPTIRAAMIVEAKFAKLDEIERRMLMKDIANECLEAFPTRLCDMDLANVYLMNLVSFASDWGKEDIRTACWIIDGIIGPVEQIADKKEREEVAGIVANAISEIAKNTKAEIRDELIKFTMTKLKGKSRTLRMALLNTLLNEKFEDREESARIILRMSAPNDTELDFIINNARSEMAKSKAEEWKVREMRGGKEPEQLDDYEKYMLEQIIGIQNGCSLVPVKTLIENLMNMDPGERYIRIRSAITMSMYDPDGKVVAKDWKKRIMDAQAAVDSLSNKLGIMEPKFFQKRNVVTSNSDILTKYQQALACKVAGMKPGPKGLVIEVGTKAIVHIDASTKMEIKEWIRKVDNLTKLASILNASTTKPASISHMSKDEIKLLSWAIGKDDSSVTDDDVNEFLNGLINKDRYAFDKLQIYIEPSIENFRIVAAKMREAYDLIDLLGKPIMPVRIKENSEGVWAGENSENPQISLILEYGDGRVTRINALFESIPGYEGSEKAASIAREVFELGAMCGMLETVHDAAVLCRIADLIIAFRNYLNMSNGKINDMLDGSGSSVSLVIQENDSLETVHIGKGKWMVFRNGSRIKSSENGTDVNEKLKKIDEEQGILSWAKGRLHSILGNDSGPAPELTEQTSPGSGPFGNETGDMGVGLGKTVELNIGEFRLKAGDVVTLYSEGVDSAVVEQTITHTDAGEDMDATVCTIRKNIEAKTGTSGFGIMAFRYGEKK